MEKQTLHNATILLRQLNDLFDQCAKGHELTFEDMELILRIFKECDKTSEIIASAEKLAHEDLEQLKEDAWELSKECDRYHTIYEWAATQSLKDVNFSTEPLYMEKIRYYKEMHSAQIELAHVLWDEYLDMTDKLKHMSELDDDFDDYVAKTADKLNEYGKELKEAKKYREEYEVQDIIAQRDYLCDQIMISILVHSLSDIAYSIIEDIDDFEEEGACDAE